MGTSSSTPQDTHTINNVKNPDLVVRDHTFDYDSSGIEYLKAHEIPQLFQDITVRLLSERPLDSLRFIRNILIHKVIHEMDKRTRHRSLTRNRSNTNRNSASLSPMHKHSQHKFQFKNINTKSAELSPINSDTISLDYDEFETNADKLLESRTNKRTRSYSDSEIMFNNIEAVSNMNDLSQPYHTHINDTAHTQSNITGIQSIASVMDDMQIDSLHKNAFLKILHENNEETELKRKEIDESDSELKIDEPILSFSKISNKLKKLSHSVKEKVSDTNKRAKSLSFSLYSKSENINENENETKSEMVNDEMKQNPRIQPLRRSRTMEQLINVRNNHSPFRHILSMKKRPCFGFDIGGSLTKISFFEPNQSVNRHKYWNAHDRVKTDFVTSNTKYGHSGIRDSLLSFPWRNGIFHFIHFETHRMNEAVKLWKSENLLQKNEIFYATGGGAHKYGKYLTEHLQVRLKKGDELKCLISGLNFLLNHVSDELYYLSSPASKQPSPKISMNIKNEGNIFPYLFINIGSGVSILKVDSATQFERISGSQIGGGTYWGLLRLCARDSYKGSEELTFKKAFELAVKGNAKKVNMLVSDIYGGDYPQCNLPGDLVASAFGKCSKFEAVYGVGDIARGLLDVIAMNCAQLAYLNAMRFKITRIIFAGNFLRQNDLSMAMISYAIHYWSQGCVRACFLKHEGYCGSIGVMLLPDKELIDD